MVVPGSLPFLRIGTKPVLSWCAMAPRLDEGGMTTNGPTAQVPLVVSGQME